MGFGTNRVRQAGPVTTMGIGLVFIAVGLLALHFTSTKPYPGGVTVTGTVIGIERHYTNHNGSSCTPVVAYSAAGQEYQARTSYGTSSACGLMGRQIQVSYRPADPAAGRVLYHTRTRLTLWLFPIVGALAVVSGALRKAGLAGGLSGVLFSAFGRRPPSAPPPAPPPGWYPDPSGGPARRWWDGRTWTEHLQSPSAQ